MKKILVVSMRFPTINQPWIDTYLEQLQKNNISFDIFTYNSKKIKYNKKVDDLGLLDSKIHFSFSKFKIITVIIKNLFLSPIKFFNAVLNSHSVARDIGISPLTYLNSLLKTVYIQFSLKNIDDYSLCHSHTEAGAYDFLHLTLLKQIPLIITFHGQQPAGLKQLERNKRALIYKNATTIFVNTEFAKNQVISIGCSPDKIITLPQGTCLDDFPFKNNRSAPDKILKILTVGRFHREKGQRYALIAIKRLQKSNIKLEWHFVGIGPELHKLKEISDKFGISNNVIFHEALDHNQLKPLYQESHIFVLTSLDKGVWGETQSVVIQEAQASGCLVIATSAGGVPECVVDGENAFLIKPSSSRAIEKSIYELYNIRQNWHEIRAAARTYVETNFSSDYIGEKMACYLKEFIQKNKITSS